MKTVRAWVVPETGWALRNARTRVLTISLALRDASIVLCSELVLFPVLDLKRLRKNYPRTYELNRFLHCEIESGRLPL
jgi:hypothetical protein